MVVLIGSGGFLGCCVLEVQFYLLSAIYSERFYSQTSNVMKQLANNMVIIFFLLIVLTCSNSTSASDMYKKVPAEMLIKKAITKCPWLIKEVPVTNPRTLISP